MAWKCDNCNHYTADGQKHECINDEVEQLREAAKELNADYESCLTSFTKIADENMLLKKQIQVLVAALEFYADNRNYTNDGIVFVVGYDGTDSVYSHPVQQQDYGQTAKIALENYKKVIL